MEPFIPDPPNPIRKLVWENLFQFLAAGFLIIVLIINWRSTDQNIKVGISLFIIIYLMFRITFIWQAVRFAKRIEKMKESDAGVNAQAEDLYEKSLRE
ncbi:MAG: hypothetical protein HeimC2_19660 [Candidatus Heimdallarchaeota archaeon LC_2]|nr:MAG: hypothetical protein HeimC2_19660 [Candidatus Heimdallarchaeota archaeon LC_2]